MLLGPGDPVTQSGPADFLLFIKIQTRQRGHKGPRNLSITPLMRDLNKTPPAIGIQLLLLLFLKPFLLGDALSMRLFGYGDKELLNAELISLQVLAPKAFYDPYDMGFLGVGIREGLNRLCEGRADGLQIDFRFVSFPPGFELPFSNGKDVRNHWNESTSEGPNQLLIQAMNNLQLVWEVDVP